MTDIKKALAFAVTCLKWEEVTAQESMRDVRLRDGRPGSTLSFTLDSAQDLQAVLQEFLGRKYFIQVNRGTSSLFHWCVIVGYQDMSKNGVSFDRAQAENNDLWDCVFDACVQAVHMFAEA